MGKYIPIRTRRTFNQYVLVPVVRFSEFEQVQAFVATERGAGGFEPRLGQH